MTVFFIATWIEEQEIEVDGDGDREMIDLKWLSRSKIIIQHSVEWSVSWFACHFIVIRCAHTHIHVEPFRLLCGRILRFVNQTITYRFICSFFILRLLLLRRWWYGKLTLLFHSICFCLFVLMTHFYGSFGSLFRFFFSLNSLGCSKWINVQLCVSKHLISCITANDWLFLTFKHFAFVLIDWLVYAVRWCSLRCYWWTQFQSDWLCKWTVNYRPIS